MRKNTLKALLGIVGAVALSGCLGSSPTGGGSGSGNGSGTTDPGSNNGGTGNGATNGNGNGNGATGSGNGATGGGNGATGSDPNLGARTVDYGQALRTAALKLVGSLPTMDEQAAVKDAASYGAQIDKYLADPRFATQIKSYFSDMMKMGGTVNATVGNATVKVNLDAAPTYAAELVVKDQSLMQLFTGTTNTCPTLNAATGAFTDANCTMSNGAATVGVLTDPGAMSQFFSNMAFRRVRWIQESFACNKFPTEFSAKPVAMGSGQFTSPWPFTSITGGKTAQIDFQDTSSVICANCHTTMNHIAPLFANFDAGGAYQTSIQVFTPTPANPRTVMADWLPATEGLAWRFGTTIKTMADLGNAMAADPVVQKCQVQRAWNWAMSKTDIVNDLAVVPDSTIASVLTTFTSSGFKLKGTLKAIFTSDDFVKF